MMFVLKIFNLNQISTQGESFVKCYTSHRSTPELCGGKVFLSNHNAEIKKSENEDFQKFSILLKLFVGLYRPTIRI